MNNSRKQRCLRVLLVFFIILLCFILGWVVFSLLGRITPASITPASWVMNVRVYDPVQFIKNFTAHETTPQLLANPAFDPVLPLINLTQENARHLERPLVRLALRGKIDVFLLEDSGQTGPLAIMWDSGFLSPALRFLPSFSRFLNHPGLYHVRTGNLSRFEYRMEDGVTLYIGTRRNLLVICNDRSTFDSLISGVIPPRRIEVHNALNPARYDAVFIFSPLYLGNILAAQDENIATAISEITFTGNIEAGISFFPRKLELQLIMPAVSGNPALSSLLERRSQIPNIAEMLPAQTQFSTIISAGSLSQLYNAAAVFAGPLLEENLRQADRASRMFFGLSIDDLLFSWSGTEFAVFGLEGRPHPVYAIRISDEQRRNEVFNRVFGTVLVSENLRLNLDGVRIPQIVMPAFLQTLLRAWNINIPSPFYVIHNDFIFLSESAETLLSAVRAIQRNDVLPRTEMWQELAGERSQVSAFFLYYSLDRSLPFFLRENTDLSAVLALYRQGLVRMAFEQNIIRLSMSLVPGLERGLVLVSGYPISVGGNPDNNVFGIITDRPIDNRIIMVRDSSVIAVNQADNTIYEFDAQGQGRIWVIPAEGLNVRNVNDPAAWIVSALGRVTLVNGNMEPVRGFPVATGLRLSAPPSAHGGMVFLSGEDGTVISVNSNGRVSTWETSFIAALRSPPSFLQLPGRAALTAVYPRTFFGEIWLLDSYGRGRPGWPVPVSGIAFGSPLLFSFNNQVFAAFLTQAGMLYVFNENASLLPSFPISVDGVFFLQPVFDGEYLWLISENGTLHRVSLRAEVLHQFIPNFTVRDEGFITAFNLRSGDEPAIFISGDGNALHGFYRDFRPIEGFPLPVWGRPFLGDLSGDGRIEFVGVGMDRLLYRWQFN